jgi:phosphate-selective porin OprO/OprP
MRALSAAAVRLIAGWVFMLTAIVLTPQIAAAQTLSAERPSGSILIRNVTLLNQPGDAPDKAVSLIIRDGKLDIVTEDAVATDSVDLALDAAGGAVLGKLEIGEPANFMIIAGDPRADISLLLDTARNASFAMREGRIIRNRLARALDAGEEQKRSAWLAYTPPPLAMPTQYTDTSKWNRWESKYVDGLFLGAVVIDRTRWTSQDDASEEQVGPIKDFGGGEIRGLRFGAVGTINFANPWVYSVFAATNAFDKGFDESRDDDLQWFDARIDIPAFADTTVSVGKQKEPISMERVTSLLWDPMQERPAAIDAMLPARNVGIVWSGNALGKRMSWAGGVFNSWLDNDLSISDSPTQLVGRVTGVPWSSSDSSNLVHLGAGLRYTNAKAGIRYFSEPEIDQSPVFVDTGPIVIDADDAYTADLEASWRKGPFWVSSEWLQTRVDSSTDGKLNFGGFHISGVWSLTGEMRSYNERAGVFNRPPVARSVYQNGWGAWELIARYSYTDLSDGAIDGGEMDVWSLGARWWLTPFLMVDMNWRAITLDRGGVSGDSQGFNTRLSIALE